MALKISDKLLYERVILIKWRSDNTHGEMLITWKHFKKIEKKFQRRFKNCDIYYMSEFVLTPEELNKLEEKYELERLS